MSDVKVTEAQKKAIESETGLVVQEQLEDGALVLSSDIPTLQQHFMTGATNFLTSMKPNGDDDLKTKVRIFNAISDNDGSISEMINQPLEVVDFLIYPVQIVTNEHEIVDAYRSVLVTASGETYGAVANGIFQSLQNIVGTIGMAPWKGVKMIPVERKTRRGFKTLTLRLDV